MNTLKNAIIITVTSTLLVLSQGCKPSDVRNFQAIQHQWDRIPLGQGGEEFAKRCLEVVEKYPNTPGELASLYLAACRAPKTKPGQKARELFITRIATADLGQLAEAFRYAVSPAPYGRTDTRPDWRYYRSHEDEAISAALLERLERSPNDPHTPGLLTRVCLMSDRDGEGSPMPQFSKAADLIASRYAASPDILNFCEILGSLAGSPAWAGSYERHLSTILKTNQARHVRFAAQFALASVVQSRGEKRQAEAKGLYHQFLEKFDGQHKYPYQGVEQQLREAAEWRLAGMSYCGIGNPAPEIVGSDLDGQPMKLSDYRGKVVLLSFWATWCGPCMKLVPHEKEIAVRLDGKPFAIVGVNGDSDAKAIQKAVTTHGITWRSFHNKRSDGGMISAEWKILGWPELYLIDQQGIIREKWLTTPSPDKLDRAIGQLLENTL